MRKHPNLKILGGDPETPHWEGFSPPLTLPQQHLWRRCIGVASSLPLPSWFYPSSLTAWIRPCFPIIISLQPCMATVGQASRLTVAGAGALYTMKWMEIECLPTDRNRGLGVEPRSLPVLQIELKYRGVHTALSRSTCPSTSTKDCRHYHCLGNLSHRRHTREDASSRPSLAV